MKISCENMFRVPYAPHGNNICFIHLLRLYILSFLLVLKKMEYGYLIKTSNFGPVFQPSHFSAMLKVYAVGGSAVTVWQ